MTRSCAGAERAVTRAVRMGEASPAGKASCSLCSAARKPLNGPPDSASPTRVVSLSWKAASPDRRETRSDSSPKMTASPSKAMRSWSWVRSGGLDGRMVAAATPCSSALRTESGLADRNSWAPKGRI